MKASFEGASDSTDGYCKVSEPVYPFNNRDLCDSSEKEHIVWKFDFYFNDHDDGDFTFDFGTDFGGGYALFLDDVYVEASQDNYWWSSSWSNSDVISIAFDYTRGYHHYEFYGFEDCCDGNFDI